MNYRVFCQEEMNNLLDSFKTMSFGECMYAILACGEIKEKKELLSISDSDMYDLISKTIKKERDE